MWVRRHDAVEVDTAHGAPSTEGRLLLRRRMELPVRAGRSGSRRLSAPRQVAVPTLRVRRIAFAVLALLLAVAAVAALLGVLAPSIVALPLLLLSGYGGWLRVTAVQAAARRREQRRLRSDRRAVGFRDFAVPQPARASADVALPLVGWSAGDTRPPATTPEPAGAEPAGAAASGARWEATASADGAGRGLWTPMSVPLPSYVTAAPGPKVVMGDFHEEDLLDGELPGEASAYGLGEEILERRRAVGD